MPPLNYMKPRLGVGLRFHSSQIETDKALLTLKLDLGEKQALRRNTVLLEYPWGDRSCATLHMVLQVFPVQAEL